MTYEKHNGLTSRVPVFFLVVSHEVFRLKTRLEKIIKRYTGTEKYTVKRIVILPLPLEVEKKK